MARRSFWAWGLESEEPTLAQRRETAATLSKGYGVVLEVPPAPTLARLDLRRPRVTVPEALGSFCSTDAHDRAVHSYGRSFRDRVRAFNGHFPNPPDVVARPRSEQQVEAVLEWCSARGYAAIPFGGGSSTVGGIEPPENWDGVVTIDLSALDRVVEIDDVSRAAHIQAGAYGPVIEDQLRPHGFTLRHYPQSFEYSSLGGWIATRSGGHYATNHTHIDDFVESVRMVTPSGIWESRRLPGSGAGPSPDRLALGSEGILGIITEAWMRIQARPRFRASAGVTFSHIRGRGHRGPGNRAGQIVAGQLPFARPGGGPSCRRIGRPARSAGPRFRVCGGPPGGTHESGHNHRPGSGWDRG